MTPPKFPAIAVASLSALCTLGAVAVFMLPVHAHQNVVDAKDVQHDTGAWTAHSGNEPVPAHRFEVKIYVQATNTEKISFATYEFEIRANDMEDARQRFVKEHMIGSNYVFLQHQSKQGKEDRLFMYEQHMVQHTEFKQED